jgi:hypothetical protein
LRDLARQWPANEPGADEGDTDRPPFPFPRFERAIDEDHRARTDPV